ncbi:MAG TPA: FAD-dependent oxidoreductase [Candidatus Saccharimonadales bacterium]|nr:FAD-dependent oxidoreductase [Candidatus Saccharimonadales bacterium]
MRVKFERKEELSPGVWHYFFVPEKALDYISGQYVDFLIPHTNPDSRGTKRTFTLTSLAEEPHLSFAVRFDEPSSSYKKALFAMERGQEATITDAMGDVVLPKSSLVPLTFVAGGLGMASFVSIMRWLTRENEARDITLLYAVRDPAAILFQDVIDQYPHPITLHMFSPETPRLTAETIKTHTADDGLVYLSGSEKFVEGYRHELQNNYAVPNERIVYDFFDGYHDL